MAKNRRQERQEGLQSNIITREVPRHDWPRFLDELGRTHHGRIITLSVLGEDIGAQEQTAAVPMLGITAELKSAGRDEVAIILGRPDENPWTRIIQGAVHVRFETTPDDAHQALQIEDAEGRTTILQFQAAASPRKTAGLLPS